MCVCMYLCMYVCIVGRRSICSSLQTSLKNDLQYHDPFPSLKVVVVIVWLINRFSFFVKVLCCYFICHELLK